LQAFWNLLSYSRRLPDVRSRFGCSGRWKPESAIARSSLAGRSSAPYWPHSCYGPARSFRSRSSLTPSGAMIRPRPQVTACRLTFRGSDGHFPKATSRSNASVGATASRFPTRSWIVRASKASSSRLPPRAQQAHTAEPPNSRATHYVSGQGLRSRDCHSTVRLAPRLSASKSSALRDSKPVSKPTSLSADMLSSSRSSGLS
jgi:hypothetical protein